MIAPSSAELIDAIAEALRARIAPQCAHDPWIASELRSIDTLLALVAGRLRHEADVVAADTADLRALLDELRARGVPVAAVDDAHDAAATNLALRSALDATLPGLHDGHHADEVALVRRYLVAATAREQRLYGPLAGRRPF